MVAALNRPLFTDSFALETFIPQPNSAYIRSTSVEERSEHSKLWEAKTVNVKFIDIVNKVSNLFEIEIGNKSVSLRSEKQLRKLFREISREIIYIDITGLDHNVWAPLLRVALLCNLQVLTVYVEPLDYRPSRKQTETDKMIYDLSEQTKGIGPIPGFTSLVEVKDEKVCFVPLIGFEGARLSFLIEKVQPPGEKIVPVIGIPGFRAEYPFYTYHGNQLPLTVNNAWRNIRFAKANCPFSLFYLLESIAADYPDHLLKIAPIGTKPHALGAVLYAIAKRPQPVELVYDYPVRKPDRTQGTARLLVYHVSALPLSNQSEKK